MANINPRKRARWILPLFLALSIGLGGVILLEGKAIAKPSEHHDLAVRLDPAKHLIHGIDRLTLEQHPASRITFYLADHMTIAYVHVNGSVTTYRFRNGLLEIPLSDNRSSHQVEIAYSGIFNDHASSQPLNTDNPGYGVLGTIQPQGTLLLSGAGWYPYRKGKRAAYHITVDAPAGTLAVTEGQNLGHTQENGRSRSRWRVNSPFNGFSLVAGPFQLSTRQFGRITAATYFTEPIQPLSPDYLKATGRYITFYEERFGPYPFDGFAVVENFFPTGYGFPSFTLMGRRVLQLPFIIHTSLGHEIAHCWWGNGVLVDPSKGNWSEGLTTYVADYLYKEQQGKGAVYRRQWLRNYASLVTHSNDLALSDFSSRMDPVTKTIGYDKGAMVFHMLRRLVGETAFWQTLRDVYGRYRFQAISWTHWQRAFEEAAARPLDRFFQQWVFKPGAPQFHLSQVSVTPNSKGYRIEGQIKQTKPYYDMYVDLVLESQTGSMQKQVVITGALTPFVLDTTSSPVTLTADPEVHLFRRLFPQELPPTINRMKGADSVLVVLSRDLEGPWLTIAKRLVTALGLKPDTAIVQEGQVSDALLENHDLLWLGRPGDQRWIPKAFSNFAMNDQGDAFTLFGVFEHPVRDGGIMALFLSASDTLARTNSTKIPHYGKYSYLLFDGTRNKIKETWPIHDSPLMFRWPDHPLPQSE